MSGIAEIQSRIHSIQNRVESPPAAGNFNAVFAAQMATLESSQASPTGEPTPSASGEYVVEPVGTQQSTPAMGSTPVTLGVMLGIAGAQTLAPRSTSAVWSADLTQYLLTHNIEARNGRLDRSELTEVSGTWNGSGYLLPPAAVAWEEMRSAAAADGIDLVAIDTYRSWEVQDGAYQAHLRGEKTANVLPPGESEHGNGLAVDITNGSLIGVGDPEYQWLRANAARFGWYPISNESWHWEYRGN